jgi:hypothetical protein
MSDRDPSQERLLELFEYRDGKLYNRIAGKCRTIGKECGWDNPRGYRLNGVDSITHRAHRLIWIMHNGDIEEDLVIDHEDGNPSNNRIDNLRKVTQQHNIFNNKKSKGYTWVEHIKKYKARITVDGKSKFLGEFYLEEDAIKSREVAKEKYHIIENR